MRVPPVLLTLVLAGLLAGCGGGGKATPPAGNLGSAAARPGFVGVTAGTPLASLPPRALLREMRLMRASRATSLREPFYWNAIEPERGRYSFNAPDAFMRTAARAHIDVLPVLVGTPAWEAAPGRPPFASPPRSPSDFGAYAATLVKRYGPAGSFWRTNPSLPRDPIHAWQIWNEPNHLRYWNPQPFDAGYVRLAKAARSAVKAADPRALVVSAGFAERSWDLIAGMERAGAKGVFDVIAIHPYTFKPNNVLRIVELVRAALRKAGEGQVPLWATEVTWSSGLGRVKTPLGFETTESDQAARLARVFPLLAANRERLGLQRAYWESWLTDDSNRLNTFDYSGLRAQAANGAVRSKPAFFAFRRFALRTGGK